MYEYVTKKKLKQPKSEITKILKKMSDELKRKYKMNTEIISVGSAKSNLVTSEDGCYDFDYNLCISKMPEEYRKNLQKLKELVRVEINAIARSYSFNPGQDSTSVITICKNDKSYSVDLGIIIREKGKYRRLVHDKKSETYILNEISNMYNLAKREKCVRAQGMWSEVRKIYLEKKNLKDGRTSFEIYAEVLNSVYNKTGGIKMSKVSGNNHSQSQMNHHANQSNPNNAANRAANNNHANQCNPNNVAYKGSNKAK